MRHTSIVLLLLLPACFNPDRTPLAGGADTDDVDVSDTEAERVGDDETTGQAADPAENPEPTPDATTGDEPEPEPVEEETGGEVGSTGEAVDPDPRPGAERRVFVTRDTFSAADVAQADQHCMATAQDAGLDGFYIAWVSTSTSDAIDRLPEGVGPYVLLDGYQTVIANDKWDLVDGHLEAAIHFDEWGGDVSSGTRAVWTGTWSDGTATVDTCLDWTVATSAQNGAQGDLYASDARWSRDIAPYCSTYARLYCFEL